MDERGRRPAVDQRRSWLKKKVRRDPAALDPQSRGRLGRGFGRREGLETSRGSSGDGFADIFIQG